MQIYVTSQFFIGLCVGIPVGMLVCSITRKKKIDMSIEKLVNILLVIVWLILHVHGFILGREVPFFFDIIGGGSVGHLIGFDISEILSNLRKGKK